MDKKLLTDAIVDIEWDMFSSVNNKGGKAACQMDHATFRIMRNSQFASWDDALLASYLKDLASAQEQGRNLMSEKYARMMEFTFPEEYARLADRLPPIDPVAAEQIEEIVSTHVQWKEALDKRYPHLSDRSRPVRSQDDSVGLPSLETYTRAELKTYSPKTISLYHTATMTRIERGESEAEQNMLHQVKQYGFENPDEADNYFSTHA